MPHPTEPPPIELARTALARASFATLATTRCPSRPVRVVTVTVRDRSDGRPTIGIDKDSPALAELAARPVATLSVPAPVPYRRLHLTGPLTRCRPRLRERPTYQLTPLTGRLVGPTTLPLAMDEFRAARPDPFADTATGILDHLATAHLADLLACARAQGHSHAEAALPRTIDRYGLGLALLHVGGVQYVRLPFPTGPIDTLDQVPPGLHMPMACRCRTT